jgi:hypothetical protein
LNRFVICDSAYLRQDRADPNLIKNAVIAPVITWQYFDGCLGNLNCLRIAEQHAIALHVRDAQTSSPRQATETCRNIISRPSESFSHTDIGREEWKD